MTADSAATQSANPKASVAFVKATMDIQMSEYNDPLPTITLDISVPGTFDAVEAQRYINAVGLRVAAELELALGACGDSEWVVKAPVSTGNAVELRNGRAQTLELQLEGSESAQESVAIGALEIVASVLATSR